MAGDKITGQYLLERMDRMEISILSSMNTKYKEIDDRVNKVESFQDKVLGISAILSSFVGLITAYVWKKVTGE